MAACATKNLPGTTGYIAIPQSQLFGARPSDGEAARDNAKIVVKRDLGFTGSALSSVLLLDGKRVAIIKPGQYLELSLKPALFGVAWSDGMGALETSATREVAIDCKAGKTYYIRMFPQAMSGIIIERSSQ
jgi:hypothetical protein